MSLVFTSQGKLLFNHVLYCTGGAGQVERATVEAKALVERYDIEAIAIGNGTAGRETEAFFRGLGLSAKILIISVNESGASIYSASEAARDEFPDQDLTVRGAVSIGRRLMDPLAELVKLDPKTIQDHVEVLEGAFLLRILPPLSVNIRKRLRKSPTIHLRDTGITSLPEVCESIRNSERSHVITFGTK